MKTEVEQGVPNNGEKPGNTQRIEDWALERDAALRAEVAAAEAAHPTVLSTAQERTAYLVHVATLAGRREELNELAEELISSETA